MSAVFAGGTLGDTYAIFTPCYAPFPSDNGCIKKRKLMDLTDMLGNSFQPELTNAGMYLKSKQQQKPSPYW